MAKTTKQAETKVVTRAEKKDATKTLIKELLATKPHKHNELIEETARIYTEKFGGEDTENINDVKGRVGSVLDIMKKESEIMYDGGMYALKARLPVAEGMEKPKKTRAKKTGKTGEVAQSTEEQPVKKIRAKRAVQEEVTQIKEEKKEEVKEEKPKKTRAKKASDKEKTAPLPPPPVQPIAPVVPVTPEVAPEPIPEDKKEEKPKKTRAKKREKVTPVEEKTEEVPQVKEENTEVKNPPAVKEKGELAKKTEVIDMSFLFGGIKSPVKEEKSQAKTEAKPQEKAEEKPVEEKAQAPVIKEEKTPLKVVKTDEKRAKRVVQTLRKAEKKPASAEERLKESFLKKLRSLGGDYFEYYSVYLLERYSMKNGRRLEGMKISGGDKDGGIDGEIELTDKLGFRETIYIQSKNWNPDKGDERLWVVGETLLQQFIGACACRQAVDKKQHCRGIFITTSRFTPDAKRILESMSDKIVGYDGEDLYEAAKECQFGLVYENGNWKLDEKLLSGAKAFFNML